jgi:hypothetical protein
MTTILRALLLVVILCLAILAVLAFIPFGKEGSSRSDAFIMLGVVGGAFVLAFIWWLAVGRSLKKALIGWVILLMPTFMHGGTALMLLLAIFEESRFQQSVRIENYREKPIQWPGFDGPIGLELSFDLRHPAGSNVMLLPPEIHMGPDLRLTHDTLTASLTGGSGYLKNYYLSEPLGDLVLLKPVMFQRVFKNPTGDASTGFISSSAPLKSGDVTGLTYHLLPGIVDYLPNPERICLGTQSHGVPACAADQKPESGCASPNYSPVTNPIYALGGDLSVLWVAAGAYDMAADLSGHLTAALRSSSALQSDPAQWTLMQKRLEPEGLTKAGYGICAPGDDTHTFSRICYCRSAP